MEQNEEEEEEEEEEVVKFLAFDLKCESSLKQ